MSCDCYVALPRGAMGLPAVVFPDHTHLLFFTDIKRKHYGLLLCVYVLCLSQQFINHVGMISSLPQLNQY